MFNKHLFNREIKKTVSKLNHRNLKDAFDAATNAEKRAKRFEGLTDDGAGVMKVKVDQHQINQVNASATSSSTNAKPYDSNGKWKQDNNCYKCGERGHYARECPHNNTTYLMDTKVLTSSLDGAVSSPIMTATEPPKVVQTITSEGQLSASMWNTMLTQLNQAQNENKQMKQFVKKYIPYKKRNQGNTNTRSTSRQSNFVGNKNDTMAKKDAKSGTTSKVNKIELDSNDDTFENFPSFLFDIFGDEGSENDNEQVSSQEEVGDTVTHINVVLSNDATMASEFPITVGDCSTTGLVDMGASHSCMSFECFEKAFQKGTLNNSQCIKVENASGKSMEPVGLCEATVTLGPKTFFHTFIVCKELTSSVILGLDFSSKYRIGTDWTDDGKMYLHQGKHKLIAGTVTSTAISNA